MKDKLISSQWLINDLLNKSFYPAIVKSSIESAPAVDTTPVRHGRWVKNYISGVTVDDGYVSTCCDMWNERMSKYCPNCGAKMDTRG